MKHVITVIMSATLAATSTLAGQTLEIVTPTGHKNLTLSQIKARVHSVTVKLDDPVYKKEKSYDAFPLFDVLKLAGPLPSNADEVVFQAQDGYAPSISLAKAHKHAAFLAFQEHGNPDKWTKVPQGKAWLSPAPFYVVWSEGRNLPEDFPSPYQLVRVELVSFSKKYAKMYPEGAKDDVKIMGGFVHFKELCMRCHSVNLQGGDLAPELNIPKNVTEYWSRDNLRAFIHNASSFRMKSKMPPFTQLSEDDVDGILAYLGYMKDHKDIH